MFFQWIQLVNAIQLTWREKIKKSHTISINNNIVKNHNLIRNGIIVTLDKLSCKDLRSILLARKNIKPTSQRYFETHFPNYILLWKNIYLLPRLVTSNTSLRNFQYKISNNILYLNQKLFFIWEKGNTAMLLL